MKGSESHKKIDLSANPILYHYYTNRVSEANVVIAPGKKRFSYEYELYILYTLFLVWL